MHILSVFFYSAAPPSTAIQHFQKMLFGLFVRMNTSHMGYYKMLSKTVHTNVLQIRNKCSGDKSKIKVFVAALNNDRYLYTRDLPTTFSFRNLWRENTILRQTKAMYSICIWVTSTWSTNIHNGALLMRPSRTGHPKFWAILSIHQRICCDNSPLWHSYTYTIRPGIFRPPRV
jgi:hypothetical protein